MAENIPFDSRKEIVKLEVARLIGKLEGAVEFDFAIGKLQERRQHIRRTTVVATESLSREFLNKRWTIFGTQYEGPWPVAFIEPLEVQWKRAGMDFVTHKPYEDVFGASVMEARFVRLGRHELARYVELQVPAPLVLRTAPERARYGVKDDEQLSVYCTLYKLIQSQPQWVLDGPTKVKIKRLQALAQTAAVTAALVQP